MTFTRVAVVVVVTRALAASLALAPAAHAATSDGATRVVRGVVKQVADQRAYLAHGSDDGLALGDTVRLADGSTCEVEALADSSATCLGTRLRAGVRYSFRAVTAAGRAAQRPSAVPAVASEDVRAQLAAAAFPVVPSRRTSSPTAARANAMVAAGTQAAATVGTNDSVFVQPWVDVVADGPLFIDSLSGGLALRATADALAPKAQRFRPAEVAQLYVFRASAVYEDVEAGHRVEAGRFFPEAPGLSIVDGAQASTRVLPTLRVGAVAGAVPTLDALAPSTDRLTMHAFAQWHPTRSDTSAAAHASARVAAPLDVVTSARVGAIAPSSFAAGRVEGELQALARWGALALVDVAAQAGVGSAGPYLSQLRVGGRATPIERVNVGSSYRFHGPQQPDLDLVGAAFGVFAAHHADVDVDWQAFDAVGVGARSGVVVDGAGEVRAYVGPTTTLALPGARVTATWIEELATFAGRSVMLDVDTSPVEGVTLRNGVGWLETAYAAGVPGAGGGDGAGGADGAPGAGAGGAGDGGGATTSHAAAVDAHRELFVSTSIAWSPLPWLSLVGRGSGAQTLPAFDATPRATPLSVLLDVRVVSRLP